MTNEHVESVATIHESSWGKDELSVKLGREYINRFYQYIVTSKYSFGFVYIFDKQIIAYAAGFYDYQYFNKFFLKENLLFIFMTLIKRIFSCKMTLIDILNLLQDDKKLSKAQYRKYHLGALALSKEYKGVELGKQAIYDTNSAVLNELKDKGYPGCWGLCNFNNVPMRNLLLKLGFEEIDLIKMIKKNVVLYEKTF